MNGWKHPRHPNRRAASTGLMARVLTTGVIVALAVAWSGTPQTATATGEAATLTIVDQNFSVVPGAQLTMKVVATGTEVEPLASALTTTTASVAPPEPEGPRDQTATAVSTEPDPLASMSIRILVHEPVTDSKTVQSVLDGHAGAVLDRVDHPLRDVAALSPNDPLARSLDITIGEPIFDPSSEGGAPKNTLNRLGPGVYPVSIQLVRDDDLVAQTTTLFERVATDSIQRGPVSVAMVMRIPSQPGADITAELTQLAELAEVTDVPLSVELFPAAVIPVLNAAPDLAARLTTALTSADVILATPQLPLDPSAAAAAELDQLYTRWMTSAVDALRQAFPSATVTNGARIIDSRLTTLGGTLLADSGSQLFVTNSTSYARFRGSDDSELDTSLLTKVSLKSGESSPLAVVDPSISALLQLAGASAADSPGDLRVLVAISADLAVVRYGTKPDIRSVLLATPSYAPPSASFIARLLPYAQGALNLTPQPVTALPGVTNTQFSGPKPVTVQLATKPLVDLSSRIEAERTSRLIVADAASMMPAQDPNVQRWSNELDEAYRTDWTDQQAEDVADRVATEADSIRRSVLAPEASELIVTGRTADLPIEIKSNASVPLTVRLHLVSDELTFPRGDQAVVLAPNETTSVIIPVEARTNGVVSLSLQLMTPAGNELNDSVTITARFTAISGMGKLITGAFVLILLTWWASYYRRHRANRRADQLAGIHRHPANRRPKGVGVDEVTASTRRDPTNGS